MQRSSRACVHGTTPAQGARLPPPSARWGRTLTVQKGAAPLLARRSSVCFSSLPSQGDAILLDLEAPPADRGARPARRAAAADGAGGVPLWGRGCAVAAVAGATPWCYACQHETWLAKAARMEGACQHHLLEPAPACPCTASHGRQVNAQVDPTTTTTTTTTTTQLRVHTNIQPRMHARTCARTHTPPPHPTPPPRRSPVLPRHRAGGRDL